jgi:Tol biopolymer transport system component
MKKVISFILLVYFLSACGSEATTFPTRVKPTFSPLPTETEVLPQAPMEIPTPVPDPTATADTRLPPERWQEWPVVPSVTGHAIEIYRKGLAMGLDPNAFSKVGDCQSVKAAFMGYLDLGNYPATFSTNYPELQETVDHFKGHFNTDGQAVRGGFNAAAVLSPLWADPQACLPGENPLECELRITRPIIVFVRMEIWWDGRTVEQYVVLMHRILDTIIAHGAVPILATKADNVEGDNSLNLATARLAYEYDLPLWNFWASVQSMPAHGMETQPPHNDGFHISTAAWSVQSFTALQALDSVWRGMLAAGQRTAVSTSVTGTPTPSAEALSVPAQTPFPTSTPTAGPVPLGGSDRIVFGLASRKGEEYQAQGIYLFDPATRQLRQIFGADIQFQSASPDGKYILVSKGTSLYRSNVDGAYPVQFTDSLFAFGERSATWLPDGQIAVILNRPGGGTEISILSEDGVVLSWLPASEALPIELYPSADANHVYWESGTCTSTEVCNRQGAWVSGADGRLNQALTGIVRPAVAPDVSILAFDYPVTSTESDLGLAGLDGSNPQQVPLPGKLLTDYAWSPSGDVLAVVLAEVSDYSGQSSGNRNFVIDPRSRSIVEYSTSDLLHPHLLWSPDGKYLFWIGSLPADHGYRIGAELVNRSSKKTEDLSDAIGQESTDYLLVTNAAWLQMP